MDRRRYGRTGECTDELMNGRTDGRVDERSDRAIESFPPNEEEEVEEKPIGGGEKRYRGRR